MTHKPKLLVETEVCTEGTLLKLRRALNILHQLTLKQRLRSCISFRPYAVVQCVNYCFGYVKWC